MVEDGGGVERLNQAVQAFNEDCDDDCNDNDDEDEDDDHHHDVACDDHDDEFWSRCQAN